VIARLQTASSRLGSSWALLVVILVVVPIFVTGAAGRFLACTVLIYAVLALSWNLTIGIAGVANFAHLAFFALGAYGGAIFTTQTGLNPWLGMLVGALVGALSGAIAFLPVIRLRGIYVALVTFVFSQLCLYAVLNQSQLTGGSAGLVGLPGYRIGDVPLAANGWLGYYILFAVLFMAVVIILDLVYRSHLGRSLIALRDREQYAMSRGVPPFRQQLIAFIISAAMAGATGSIYASFVGVVAPELFGFGYTTLVLSILFLGGIGSTRGPIVAAVAITIVSDVLKNTGPWRFIVIAGIIMVVLWFLPTGLAGLAKAPGDALRNLRRRKRPTAAG
jgi:branched-chain amino acid transport system permease protein